MGSQSKFLLLGIVLTTGLLAQKVPVRAEKGSRASLIAERDKAKEDQVAKSFESIRTNARLTQLKRIGHRDSLEQRVCTIALVGIPPKLNWTDTFVFYRTLQPEAISDELKRVASYDNFHFKHSSSYERYSVAVWRVRDSQTGEAAYWVGVQLYWSAALEFFDNHFTDDIFYHDDWKKSVAPECRGN